MHRALRTILAAALLGTTACGLKSHLTAPPPADIMHTTFAPSLGVDPSTMAVTASGLYMRDDTVGTGATAEPGDSIAVNYTGWFPNGTKFDSSLDPNRQPLEFKLGVGRVIAGWDEGVQGMKVGGVRTLIIPPQLAYGASGIGPIPPNAILVFRVELLAIK